MRKAVGFVEIKSIPVGIQTADEMVKAGNVELLLATPICPGKYVIIVGGHVGPVKAAMSKAELVSGIYLQFPDLPIQRIFRQLVQLRQSPL